MTQLIQRPLYKDWAHQKLQVRENKNKGCWEVFTYLNGSKDLEWRWFQITSEIAQWYIQVHHATVMETIEKDENKENGNEII